MRHRINSFFNSSSFGPANSYLIAGVIAYIASQVALNKEIVITQMGGLIVFAIVFSVINRVMTQWRSGIYVIARQITTWVLTSVIIICLFFLLSKA
ncbi:MAG: hypothetical protein RLZZ292_96 [Bacteroidota bacterium]|jgi:hypothetical protein